jgi:hypothetical protein
MEDNKPPRVPSTPPQMPNTNDELGEGFVRTNGRGPCIGAPFQDLTVSQMSVSTIAKLTGSENYGIWKFQMSIMFRARKLMGIVNGTITKEASEDKDEWNDRDAAFQSLLVSVIDPKLMRRLKNCVTAYQMWRRLATIHEQNATENVQLLQQ